MIVNTARSVMPTSSASSRSRSWGSRARQISTWLWLVRNVQRPPGCSGGEALEIGRLGVVRANRGRIAKDGQQGLSIPEAVLLQPLGQIVVRDVDDLEAVAVLDETADLALDGHAGPVADVLVKTGEQVEDARLAGIRVSRKRDLDSFFLC